MYRAWGVGGAGEGASGYKAGTVTRRNLYHAYAFTNHAFTTKFSVKVCMEKANSL